MQLLILGDVAITNENEIRTAWEPLLEDFPGEDNRILLNWEFPVGTQKNPAPRGSGKRYLAHPLSPAVIKKWAPGFATLATNHMLDANPDGVDATIQALQGAGFITVGAGDSVDKIKAPLIWETTEGRLAIINWVFEETNPDWQTVPGVNGWPGLDTAEVIIRETKAVADWLIIILHWSDELFAYPRPEDRTIAKALSAFGVDAIICHHPHVVRGMEEFNSVPVFYSIGNFYFSEFQDSYTELIEKSAPRNREALGVKLSFSTGRKPTYQLISFLKQGLGVVKDDNQTAARRLAAGSKPLDKFSGNMYEKWYTRERDRFLKWSARWHFGVRRLGLIGLVRYGLNKIRKS